MKGLMGGVPLNPFDAHSDLSECLLRVSEDEGMGFVFGYSADVPA